MKTGLCALLALLLLIVGCQTTANKIDGAQRPDDAATHGLASASDSSDDDTTMVDVINAFVNVFRWKSTEHPVTKEGGDVTQAKSSP